MSDGNDRTNQGSDAEGVGAALLSAIDRHQFGLVVMLLTSVYSIVRYHVFRGVAWEQLPLYTMNKATSFAAVILFSSALWRATFRSKLSVEHSQTSARIWFRDAMWLSAAHIFLSLALLVPEYYPSLLGADGKYTLTGSLCILTGVLASSVMQSARRVRVSGIILGIAAAAHVAFLGYGSWLKPHDWPGYMPPITFLSFCFGIATAWYASRPKS